MIGQWEVRVDRRQCEQRSTAETWSVKSHTQWQRVRDNDAAWRTSKRSLNPIGQRRALTDIKNLELLEVNLEYTKSTVS